MNEGGHKTMNTIKNFGCAGISSIVLSLLAPSVSFAEAAVNNEPSTHSLVHRVSHSLAGADAYTSSRTAGYKWGQVSEQNESSKAKWSGSNSVRSSYKWGDDSAAKPESKSYAGASSFQWGTMNFSDQSGYRWGARNFSDQAGYRWGAR